VSVEELRGVDSAAVFSAGAAATLKNDYGVRWTGVYIGGACSAGSGWDRGSVQDIYNATGWSFLPTYVGQESASICGAHNLTSAQGTSDGHDAAAIMPGFGWDANKSIPITLDVEQATYEDDPSGTLDYVRGWVSAVKADGYRAYVYSNPDGINAMAAANLGIDAVWVASYFYSGFESVTPYDLDQIGNYFSNQNRAWQYAGNVFVSGVGHVDCDVADFLLAPAPGGSNGSGGGGGSSSGGSSGDKPCELAGHSYSQNTCTETLQCEDGSWVARSSDPSSCNTGIEANGACLTDSGSASAQNDCTETLQCDDGSWTARTGDPAECDHGIEPNGACITDSGSVDAQNTCTSTLQCDDGVWVDREDDPAACL
jgi:hypothetical protein